MLQKFILCVNIGIMNFKQIIANSINFEIENVNFADNICESASLDKGDFCLPCFPFAKTLHDSPINIAKKISENITPNPIIEKVELLNGYINFFLNKNLVAQNLLDNFNAKDFKTSEGKGKVVLIDYGSPNLAKFLHIGHLKTIVIGECLARLFEQCGYTVKRLNFIGDYGTPFGKIIGGLLEWGSVEEIEEKGNEALQSYYVKYNQMEAQDPSYTDKAREIFKKIEDRDEKIFPIYQKVIEIGLKDAKEIFNELGVTFDDYRGEMHYNQFVPELIKLLEKKHLLKTSEGAKIVEFEDGMSPALIVKSDGTTLYTTRDLTAAIDRYKEYKFDKILYVTAVEQVLHFQQVFKILEMAGLKFAKDMEHVPYGRFSLPEGKISSRLGKQAALKDLLQDVLNRANDVIKNRTFNIENPNDVANKVARGVLNYNVLKVERTKDCVFDMEKAFSFEGETAPYMQYTYTRLESIIRKYNETDTSKTKVKPDYSCINAEAMTLIKWINDFGTTIKLALNKRDASIISNKLMDMCKTFNKFYTNTKVIDGNDATTKAKINLVKALKDTLAIGFNLICIDTLKEM